MGAPPAAVTAALDRVGRSVEAGRTGWRVAGSLDAADAAALADALYATWYTQPERPAAPQATDPPLSRDDLVSALRAAAARPAAGDEPWTVTAAGPRGTLAAACGDAARVLRPGEYVMPLRPGVPPAPGEHVEPVLPLDHLDAERGLWWTWAEPAPAAPIGRVYLDVRPATAARAVHEVTSALAGFAHQLKCPVRPEACRRVDAVVAYHRLEDRDAVLAALLERRALPALLDPAVPPLTRRVRAGVGWADDPGGGLSFGESRCRILAAAIVAAAGWSAASASQRREVLVAALAEAGVDPAEPWRCA